MTLGVGVLKCTSLLAYYTSDACAVHHLGTTVVKLEVNLVITVMSIFLFV